jgi:GTP-binding protein
MAEFVDEAQLHARAGDGGAGAVSMRREAHVDMGGPDGGDGGNGGDVWLVADRNQASLLGFRDHPFRRAQNGTHGKGKKMHGARGADIVVPIPVGTVIRSLEGELVCDLENEGDRWLAAEGGKGGMGNARFLSNRRRAPAFAEQGERGEEFWFNLELKLVADVALVGFPNVGKSTLIASVSAAKPKIADYPFTTLIPNLGVVRVGSSDDLTEFVMADIPGLIEGAAEGRGLGHQFLRHIERARVLVLLLDLADPNGITPSHQLEALLDELGRYQPSLLDRPRLVLGSRADMADEATVEAVDEGLVDLVISSVTRQGLSEVVDRLGAMVSKARASEAVAASDEVRIHRPARDVVHIERLDDGAYEVVGRAAGRAVRFSNLTDEGALAEVVRRLERLGVDRLLRKAGIGDGDTVVVGDVEFSWWKDQASEGIDPSQLPRRTKNKRAAE